MPSRSSETLAARIVDRAQALVGETTPTDEPQPAGDIKEKLEKEKAEHAALAARADDATLRAGRGSGGRKPTDWFVDDEPNIPGLPEGVTVSYQVVPPDEHSYGFCNALRVRLETEEGERSEGTLAYLWHKDRQIGVTFRVGDQEESHDSGVVQALSDGNLPVRLMAMDSFGEDFAIIERGVDIAEQGELSIDASGVNAGGLGGRSVMSSVVSLSYPEQALDWPGPLRLS